jgi:hypothetical protein
MNSTSRIGDLICDKAHTKTRFLLGGAVPVIGASSQLMVRITMVLHIKKSPQVQHQVQVLKAV